MRSAEIFSITWVVAAAVMTFPARAACANPERVLVEQPAPPANAVKAPPADDLPRFTAEELDELLGPIALYPDVLLSAVLAAAVFPDQVAAAAVLVKKGTTDEQLEIQGWEDPVLAIAKVPEVVTMMGQYPDWTNALGTAFLIQSWDVMDSVQRLRAIAFQNGALQTTPQHIITVEPKTQYIIIAPANPTVIFVPRYYPSVVFVRDNRSVATAGLIGFGTGIVVGAIIWGGSTNWNSGVVVWGRGGWWGWNNSNNNRTTININNNRNTNININRPGNSTNVGITRLPERIGNEGNRWTPDRSRPGVGGSATGPGASNISRDRVNDWRANRPDSRPPGSIAVPPSGPGLGGNRPSTNNDRPSIGNRPTPTSPPANRLPATRPGVGSGASANDRLPVNRPSTLPARPAGTPTTGNRTSAFSGGPGNAAANRGANSRAAATRPAAGGASVGGGGGGARRGR